MSNLILLSLSLTKEVSYLSGADCRTHELGDPTLIFGCEIERAAMGVELLEYPLVVL